MNGIDTLKEIMRRHPVPVIVVSSHSTDGASVTLKALGLGAFDFVTKPKDASAHMAEIARRTDCQNQGRGAKLQACNAGTRQNAAPHAQNCASSSGHARTRSVAIGISTGGPQALEYVLSQLPRGFPGNDSGGAAHAGGLHRNVCATAGRSLLRCA